MWFEEQENFEFMNQLVSQKGKEQRMIFPDPKQDWEEGVVAVSEGVSSELLYEAYSFGIFPWPAEESPVFWFCPEERGVLFFDQVHWSKSFKKFLKKHPYRLSFNEDFSNVIEECSNIPRSGESGTWITQTMKDAYKKFHHEGLAHSVECWSGQDLVGGLYGVYINGVFSGESMFFKQANTSKLCLYYLIEALKSQGRNWIDIQVVTDILATLGGELIEKKDYLKLLEKGQ